MLVKVIKSIGSDGYVAYFHNNEKLKGLVVSDLTLPGAVKELMLSLSILFLNDYDIVLNYLPELEHKLGDINITGGQDSLLIDFDIKIV